MVSIIAMNFPPFLTYFLLPSRFLQPILRISLVSFNWPQPVKIWEWPYFVQWSLVPFFLSEMGNSLLLQNQALAIPCLVAGTPCCSPNNSKFTAMKTVRKHPDVGRFHVLQAEESNSANWKFWIQGWQPRSIGSDVTTPSCHCFNFQAAKHHS